MHEADEKRQRRNEGSQAKMGPAKGRDASPTRPGQSLILPHAWRINTDNDPA